MPQDEFVQMISHASVLGDGRLKTQHFVGQSRWERVSPSEVVGYHQLRVPHQRYERADLKDVAVKGHAHSTNVHWYRKVAGRWTFAGLNPDIRWTEYDFDRVFADGRDQFAQPGTSVGQLQPAAADS